MSIFSNVDHEEMAEGAKKYVPKAVAAFFLIIVVFTAFEWIGTTNTGVVLRFGKHVRNMNTGPNFKLPWPLETVEEVETKNNRQIVLSSDEVTKSDEAKHDLEMLTKDVSKLKFELAIQYKVHDPVAWLYSTYDAEKVMEYVSLSIARKVVGSFDFQEAYSSKRAEVGEKIKQELQKQLDNLDGNGTTLGAEIITVQVQNPAPPDQVKPQFDEVMKANNQKETKITDAGGQAASITNKAVGEAASITNKAEGEKTETINGAKAEVEVYTRLLEQYKQMPNVTKNEFERGITEESLNGVKRVIDKRGGTLFRNQ
jgi:membrane protease subunit HflK